MLDVSFCSTWCVRFFWLEKFVSELKYVSILNGLNKVAQICQCTQWSGHGYTQWSEQMHKWHLT